MRALFIAFLFTLTGCGAGAQFLRQDFNPQKGGQVRLWRQGFGDWAKAEEDAKAKMEAYCAPQKVTILSRERRGTGVVAHDSYTNTSTEVTAPVIAFRCD